MKLQQNKHNGQFFLNLPQQLILALNWKPGINIEIKVADRGKLLLIGK